MLSAHRALTRARQIGVPLPELPALHDLYSGFYKFRFRGGQQTMIAGMPGSQKSGFMIYLIAQWAAMGLPSLYVSADMDQHTATTRLVASLSGHTTESVASGLSAGAEDYYADLLGNIPARFMFNPNPSMDDVRDELDAWVEMWDNYPRIIVLDNLLDIIPVAGDNEFTGYKSILLDGKTLARETGAAVFTLHHMSESGGDPTKPSSRKFIMGKVSQTPENVLSVAMNEELTQFLIAVVKQRNGPSDATASNIVTLAIHPERNTFERHYNMSSPVRTWQSKENDD